MPNSRLAGKTLPKESVVTEKNANAKIHSSAFLSSSLNRECTNFSMNKLRSVVELYACEVVDKKAGNRISEVVCEIAKDLYAAEAIDKTTMPEFDANDTKYGALAQQNLIVK